MNKNTLHGEWNVLKGKVKEKWGKLTNDDITQINGKRDQLVGKIEERYGYAKDRAERELSDWEKTGCQCGSKQDSQQEDVEDEDVEERHNTKKTW